MESVLQEDDERLVQMVEEFIESSSCAAADGSFFSPSPSSDDHRSKYLAHIRVCSRWRLYELSSGDSVFLFFPRGIVYLPCVTVDQRIGNTRGERDRSGGRGSREREEAHEEEEEDDDEERIELEQQQQGSSCDKWAEEVARSWPSDGGLPCFAVPKLLGHNSGLSWGWALVLLPSMILLHGISLCICCKYKLASIFEWWILPAGDYEYIDILIREDNGHRLILDIDFKSQFEVARPTPTYEELTDTLPTVFVGSESKLNRIISILCSAAEESLRERGLHIPPWRTATYMQSKWLSAAKCHLIGRGSSLPPSSSSSDSNHCGNYHTDKKKNDDDDDDNDNEGYCIRSKVLWAPPPPAAGNGGGVKGKRRSGSTLSSQFSDMSINCC